jgi:hypothetical protein
LSVPEISSSGLARLEIPCAGLVRTCVLVGLDSVSALGEPLRTEAIRSVTHLVLALSEANALNLYFEPKGAGPE